MLEALPAQHRPSLRGPERNRSLFPALRAVSPGFRLRIGITAGWPMRRRRPQHRHSFTLAVFTALRFVLKLFVVEKQLFTRCEHKIRPTIDALENLVLVFH